MNSRVILGAVDEAVVDSGLLVAGCGLAGCSEERVTLKGHACLHELAARHEGGVGEDIECAGVRCREEGLEMHMKRTHGNLENDVRSD